MYEWIKLGGVSSADKSVTVLEYSHTPIPLVAAETTEVPGRISQLQSAYGQLEPQDIRLKLAILGTSRSAIRETYRTQIGPWLRGAALASAVRYWTARPTMEDDALPPLTVLQLDDEPDRYYLGRVVSAEVSEDTDAYLVIDCTFRANPAVSLRALSVQSGYVPQLTTPIAEQITAGNATCSATLTAAGTLTSVAYTGAHPAALYLVVTGTWTRLTLAMGGRMLAIGVAATTATTLYIDCDEQLCYRVVESERVSHAGAIGGDYPQLRDPGALSVGGTAINVTVRLLVIER